MIQLKDFSEEKLIEWWDVFNHWKWPNDFPVEKPMDWETLPSWREDSERSKYSLSHPYMSAIERLVERKEILRDYHVKKLKYKNFQFEVWWLIGRINGFFQRHVNKNFFIDIYSIMKWRGKSEVL